MDISIIIPVYNEEGSIEELIFQIQQALAQNEVKQIFKKENIDYEILFISDGSTDKTNSIIKKLAKQSAQIKLIAFRTNCGKALALNVGFQKASGTYIITMDGDLQDNPDEIQNIIQSLQETDVVSGWKKIRYDPISKTFPSKIFNGVTAYMTGIPLHDFNCGLKGYRSEVVKSLEIYGEMHRYIPVLAKWNGFTVSEIIVEHRPRKFGSTKYGASRFVKGFLDLLTVLFITKYMKRPMHFFGILGLSFFLFGLGINGYLTALKIMYAEYIGQRPILFLGILLMILGVQFMSLGLLGEMITKNSQHNQYSIKETVNI